MSRPIAVIDCGSKTIKVIIAELDDNGKGRIVGVGQAPSVGIRRGVVVNIDNATDAIRTAAEAAEQMAGVVVQDAFVAIAGEHIQSLSSRGIIAVSRTGHADTSRITAEDVERVVESAKNQLMLRERQILHVLPREFTVDSESGIRESPIGITGFRLEVEVHIVTTTTASAQNLITAVNRAGIHISELVFGPLASGYSALTDDERELGVALLDIGAGTTDITVFLNGSVQHTASIGLGGQNVTMDIARMLSLPMQKAEQIKVASGGLFPPDNHGALIDIEVIEGQNRQIEQYDLNEIIAARMEEIYELVWKELKRDGWIEKLGAGIVLTGGAAQLRDSEILAKEVFQKAARVGIPVSMPGISEYVRDPSFSTAVGLVLYGLESIDAPGQVGTDDSEKWTNTVDRVKNWLKKNFT